MDNKVLQIKVVVADKKYGIFIPLDQQQPEEEQRIRSMAQSISKKVKDFQSTVKGVEKEDCLAMIALEMAVDFDKRISKAEKDKELIEQRLSMLEDQLSQEIRLIKGQKT